MLFRLSLIDDFRSDLSRGVSHFWICPNPTPDAVEWAHSFDIRIIEYSPADENHEDVAKILNLLSNFGVWQAEDSIDGRPLAVKILHEDVLHEREFLEAFRRGIRAMKLLSDGRVIGMVRFVRAYDVPACVFMDFVEGKTFEEVVDGRMLATLTDTLRVVRKVAEIILSGHQLDEHVLHRDLKPSNVMLKNIFDPDARPEVVVLDFDLSWYEGAFGKSMVSSAINNYIAPEQFLSRKSEYSSRHTAVDVFGIGMLLYYACTNSAPRLNVQDSTDFLKDLTEKMIERWPRIPRGVIIYLSLIVKDATYTRQDLRAGLPETIDRLQSIEACLSNEEFAIPSDLGNILLAAELTAQVDRCKVSNSNFPQPKRLQGE